MRILNKWLWLLSKERQELNNFLLKTAKGIKVSENETRRANFLAKIEAEILKNG